MGSLHPMKTATVIVRLQNAEGELIDPDFAEFIDAKTMRTARHRAQKFCYDHGLYTERASGASKTRLDNYEYWNVLTEREMYRWVAIQKDKEQAANGNSN